MTLHVAAPPSLSVDARVPTVLLALTPRGVQHTARTAALVQAADRAARTQTSLSIQSAEQAGVDGVRLGRCESETLFGCLVTTVEAAGNGLVGLWLLSARGPATSAQLSLRYIDLSRAAPIVRSQGRPADLEDALFAELVSGPPQSVNIDDSLAVERYFRAQLGGPFLAALGSAAGKLGTVKLAGVAEDVEVRVDGKTVGVVGPAGRVLRDMRPGNRTVTLVAPSGAVSRTVLVSAGATETLDLPLPDRPSALPSAIKWTGLAVAGVGVVAATVGLSTGGGFEQRCLVGEVTASACASVPSRAAFDGDLALSTESVNRTPATLTGAGIGLVTAGLGAALGATLFDDNVPLWASVAVAVGLGVGAFAVGSGI